MTGPITPAELERALGPLADLAARDLEQPAKMRARTSDSAVIEARADVAAPTLAVALPIATDIAEREREYVLLDQVSLEMHAGRFGDHQNLVLWLPLDGDSVEDKRTKLAAALAGSITAIADPSRAPPRTGRMPVRRDTDFGARPLAESFEHAQVTHLTHDLAALDNVLGRVLDIAAGTDLDAILRASDALPARDE